MMQEYKAQLNEQEVTIASFRDQTSTLIQENKRLKEELLSLSASQESIHNVHMENENALSGGSNVASAYISAINAKKTVIASNNRPTTRSVLAEKNGNTA